MAFMRTTRSLVFILLLATVLLLVQLIAANHDLSLNVSTRGGGRLDPRTANILKRLNFDVEVMVFYPAGIDEKWSARLLGMFSRESRHIRFSIPDPDLKPLLARTYGITRYGQTVILARGRSVVLEKAGEEEIANSILSLELGRKKNIYVLAGHGEADIFSNGRSAVSGLRESLERSGYGVHKSILAGQENVPWDTDLLVIPGPSAELGSDELYAVNRFITRGGKVLIALEPRMDGGLKAMLSEMGVVLNDATIVDTSSRAVSGDGSVLVVDSYGDMKGLEGFPHATVFPTARPLRVAGKLPSGISISAVALTSGTSFETEAKGADPAKGAASGREAASKGPRNVALLVKKTGGKGIGSSIMVFGDVDFLTNAYLTVSGNRDLAMKCVGLLLQGEGSVAIDPGSAADQPFILTPGQAFAMFLFAVVILPLPFILTGFLLGRKRGRA
jgi:hypothetical protein